MAETMRELVVALSLDERRFSCAETRCERRQLDWNSDKSGCQT